MEKLFIEIILSLKVLIVAVKLVIIYSFIINLILNNLYISKKVKKSYNFFFLLKYWKFFNITLKKLGHDQCLKNLAKFGSKKKKFLSKIHYNYFEFIVN